MALTKEAEALCGHDELRGRWPRASGRGELHVGSESVLVLNLRGHLAIPIRGGAEQVEDGGGTCR